MTSAASGGQEPLQAFKDERQLQTLNAVRAPRNAHGPPRSALCPLLRLSLCRAHTDSAPLSTSSHRLLTRCVDATAREHCWPCAIASPRT
jgi:hypothetical protein